MFAQMTRNSVTKVNLAVMLEVFIKKETMKTPPYMTNYSISPGSKVAWYWADPCFFASGHIWSFCRYTGFCLSYLEP